MIGTRSQQIFNVRSTPLNFCGCPLGLYVLEFSAAILELHSNFWVAVICGLRSGLPDRIMRSDWSEQTKVRKFAAGSDQRKGGK